MLVVKPILSSTTIQGLRSGRDLSTLGIFFMAVVPMLLSDFCFDWLSCCLGRPVALSACWAAKAEENNNSNYDLRQHLSETMPHGSSSSSCIAGRAGGKNQAAVFQSGRGATANRAISGQILKGEEEGVVGGRGEKQVGVCKITFTPKEVPTNSSNSLCHYFYCYYTYTTLEKFNYKLGLAWEK